MTEFFIKLGKVDRRYIFIIIAIVVIVPLLKPIGLPIRPTQSSQMVFDSIESLPRGSKILRSFEYGPSTKPEIHPMAIGVLRHVFRNGHQVYVTCLWPDGLFMALEALKEIADDEFGKVYGEDYVLLGFRPGNEAVVKGIVSNIRKLYTIDARNTLVENIPMMEGINKFEDFDYLFSLSAVYPGTIEWVQYAADPTGVPMSTGVTSIQVNEVLGFRRKHIYLYPGK